MKVFFPVLAKIKVVHRRTVFQIISLLWSFIWHMKDPFSNQISILDLYFFFKILKNNLLLLYNTIFLKRIQPPNWKEVHKNSGPIGIPLFSFYYHSPLSLFWPLSAGSLAQYFCEASSWSLFPTESRNQIWAI